MEALEVECEAAIDLAVAFEPVPGFIVSDDGAAAEASGEGVVGNAAEFHELLGFFNLALGQFVQVA